MNGPPGDGGGGETVLMLYLSMADSQWKKAKVRELYDRYYRQMWAVARRCLESDRLAEDAVHNAFLRVIRSLERVCGVPEERLPYYLAAIVKNECVSLLRKERPTVPLEDWEAFEDETETADGRGIVEIIRSMPETYRAALEMKFLQELPDREIANALGLSLSAVRARISRGRALLQKRLLEEGYTP